MGSVVALEMDCPLAGSDFFTARRLNGNEGDERRVGGS